MLRKHFTGLLKPEQDFEWRGKENTRLENFSDAVFAFAVTLLVVSLEVPSSFRELLVTMRGFVAFAACFAILVTVWSTHCKFFRRYGLQTTQAIFLNSVLLFCLLFYIYPLKFLFVLMFSGTQIQPSDGRLLLLIYGAGYAANPAATYASVHSTTLCFLTVAQAPRAADEEADQPAAAFVLSLTASFCSVGIGQLGVGKRVLASELRLISKLFQLELEALGRGEFVDQRDVPGIVGQDLK